MGYRECVELLGLVMKKVLKIRTNVWAEVCVVWYNLYIWSEFSKIEKIIIIIGDSGTIWRDNFYRGRLFTTAIDISHYVIIIILDIMLFLPRSLFHIYLFFLFCCLFTQMYWRCKGITIDDNRTVGWFYCLGKKSQLCIFSRGDEDRCWW